MKTNAGAQRSGSSSAVARFLSHSVLASVSLMCFSAHNAAAQTAGPAPVRQNVDENGVDLFLGTFNIDAPEVSMGDSEQGLSYYWYWRGNGWSDTVSSRRCCQTKCTSW